MTTFANSASFRTYDATLNELIPVGPTHLRPAGYEPDGLIGLTLSRPEEMPAQIMQYPIFDAPTRLENYVRPAMTRAKQIRFNQGSVQVICINYAAGAEAPIEYYLNADLRDTYIEGVERGCEYAIRIAVEKAIKDTLNATTAVTSVFAIGSAWNASANAGRALQTVESVLQYVEDTGGYRPNVIGFGKSAWRAFAANSSVLAACGNWVTPQRVAEVYRVGTVAVAQNLRDSSGEGLPLSPDAIFDDVVYCVRQPKSSSVSFEPRHSATCYWIPSNERASVPGIFNAFRHPYDGKSHSQPVEVSCWIHPVILDNKLGAAIKGVNSAQAGGLV